MSFDVSRLEVTVDGLSDPGLLWDVYHGPDNDNWTLTQPLSIEWEDSRMDRFHGGAEACRFTRSLDFAPSNVAFDAAFDKEQQ